MKAEFLARAIVLGMVSVSPALGDSIILDGSSSPVNLGPFNVGDTFTLTVGFEFMPALTTPDLFGYIEGEIALEAEIRFDLDPTKLSLLNGGVLLEFDADNGMGTFDLYAPGVLGTAMIGTTLILQFEALMDTQWSSEITN